LGESPPQEKNGGLYMSLLRSNFMPNLKYWIFIPHHADLYGKQV
jgi:hypothetical protein